MRHAAFAAALLVSGTVMTADARAARPMPFVCDARGLAKSAIAPDTACRVVQRAVEQALGRAVSPVSGAIGERIEVRLRVIAPSGLEGAIRHVAKGRMIAPLPTQIDVMDRTIAVRDLDRLAATLANQIVPGGKS